MHPWAVPIVFMSVSTIRPSDDLVAVDRNVYRSSMVELKTGLCLGAEVRWRDAGFTNRAHNVDFLYLSWLRCRSGFLSVLGARQRLSSR
jgi:hypothetical protein